MSIESDHLNSLIESLCSAGLSGKLGERGLEKYVKVWIKDGFHCAYCGAYLLKDKISLTSAQLDHILPKSKYDAYVSDENNWVLSCYCCNQLKRTFDPLDQFDEDKRRQILENLSEGRDELINLCRDYLEQYLSKKDDILRRVKLVLIDSAIHFIGKESND